MSRNISITFNADTGKYIANINAATGAVDKQAEAVVLAKNKILDSYKMQMEAAAEVGASAKELEAIQTRTAQMIASVSDKNADRIINNLDRISAKQKAVQVELSALNSVSGIPKDGGQHFQVSDRTAAVGFTRALEGDSSIRTVESFISSIPGAASAMKSLFPILGAAGLAGLVVDLGEKGYEAFQKLQALPNAIAQGFEELTGPMQSQVDGLRKTNDQLEIEIAHLEHKPANTLALALDETRQRADELAASARKAALDVEKLLKENSVGWWKNLFTGNGTTSELDTEISKRFSEIAGLQREYKEAVRGGDTKQADAIKGNVDGRQKSLEQYLKEQRAMRNGQTDVTESDESGNTYNYRVPYASRYGDQTAANNTINGALDILYSQQDSEAEQKRNIADVKKQQDLKDARDRQRAASEAERKAIEEQRRRWKQEDDARVQNGDDTPFASMKAWNDRLSKLSRRNDPTGQQRDFANNEYTSVYKEWARKDEEAIKEAATRVQKSQKEAWDVQHSDWSSEAHRTAQDEEDYWDIRVLEAARGSENERYALEKAAAARRQVMSQMDEADRARSRAALQRGEQGAAYDAAMVAINQQTGRISAYDATVQMAAIHTKLYEQQLADLRKELDRQVSLDPKSAGTVNAQAALDKASSNRSIQVIQDQATVAAQTVAGALTNAIDQWSQRARDTAAEVKDLFDKGMDGLNENLTDAMSGDKTDWKGYGKSMFKTAAGDGLQQIEGMFLGGSGNGKPDGTGSNPFHVVVDKTMEQRAGSFLTGAFTGSDDSGEEVSGTRKVLGGAVGFLGKLFGGLFGGGRALGGGVQPGVEYDVGEMGRERFVPSVPGTIIPNNKLGSGAAMYSVNVANGVTPEQMSMHVQEALKKFHPEVVRSSVSAMHEYQRRNISSKR